MSASLEGARNALHHAALALGDRLAKQPNGDASSEAATCEVAAIEYRNAFRKTSKRRTIVDVKAGLVELREAAIETPDWSKVIEFGGEP